MSKPNIRKTTADSTKCNTDSSRRPSVFERLGTKPAITAASAQNISDYCRNWALNGSCSYGKSCKYANTHTLISPSKRAKKDNAIASTSGLIEDPFKRLTSKIVKKASHSPDLNIEEWNQTDLEYEDEKVLERRRQLLQRELELQMKKDKEVHGKDKVRQKKKAMSSSSSSRTSSTSSSSSSSSSEDSSSTSTSDSRKKVKKIKTKRHYGASTEYDEDKERKRKLKLKRLGAKNDKAVNKKKRKLENNSTKKDITVRSIKKHGSSRKHSSSLHSRSPTIQQGSASGITSSSSVVLGSSVSVAHHASSTSKIRERNRSESPKAVKSSREMDKEDSRHCKKVRDVDECLSKDTIKCKSFEKIKEQQDKEKNRTIDEKIKLDDRQRSKCKDKDVRSRTPPPPSSERSSKHQHIKEIVPSKMRRSRTPDKGVTSSSLRARRDLTPAKNPEKQGNSSNRVRDMEKKERDSHKRDKSKEREDVRKSEQTSSSKAKQIAVSSQDESYRRSTTSKDNFDEKTYGGDKARQKSRERQREKETRDDRHSRLSREQRQESQRDKDKDESQERCRAERQRERDRDRDRDRERERERDRDRDRDRDRERERERERERDRETRERDRDRDREREKPVKSRERDVPAVVSSATLSLPVDKNSRYSGRVKERPLSKDVPFEKSSGTRERSRSERERERSETKALTERERGSVQSRLDGRYERSGIIEKDTSSRGKSSVNSPRDRMDRFRETSLDRAPLHDKGGHAATSSGIQSAAPLPSIPTTSSSTSAVVGAPTLSSSRDHLLDMVDNHYDRDRHRRFGVRYERGHAEHSSRKDQARIETNRVPIKIDRIVDRRDTSSPRRAIDVDRNFSRNYGRMPEHWDEQEDSSSHVEYRDHAHIHEDDRRKTVEGRRYDSPFEERRVAREERSRESRYVIQTAERTSFDDHRHHHHHHRHPIYPGDKIRSAGVGIRDENVSNEDWEAHHRDVEHGRDRGYPTVEWEEREWRTRSLWEGRDSLPRSEIHDEEWNSRYDNSISDWKPNDARKWDNQNVHVRSHYRNERAKDLELGESAQHSKRRSYNAPETREEPAIHPSAKQAAIYGSMKDEPINKKLMELAEGRSCTTSREKSTDNFQKKILQKEKPEIKEPILTEPKRPIADESLQTLHTESDLSDISDDPDDILNMEEDTTDIETSKARTNKKAPDAVHRDAQLAAQEPAQLSPKEPTEETIFSSKSKDNADMVSLKNMEDDNMETMDFEEISDGELEEDIKTSGKGLGDALGVDWESLVKETQARRTVSSNQNSTNRWQCKAVFYRIGISKKYAGEDFMKKLLKKYEKNDNKEFLLDNIALMHTALARNRLLQDLGNGAMHTVDDSLYRNNNVSYNEDVDYDWETLKPNPALHEEAKCLLQQVV